MLTECGGGLAAVAVDGEQTQVRSHPSSLGSHMEQSGYERFLALDLPGEAPRVAAEAAALLHAPACPAGRTTLILAGEQLASQIHESIGHAVELDRVLGREASYAGTSFVAAGGTAGCATAPPQLNVTADATLPGGLGSYRWDDEGVEAHARRSSARVCCAASSVRARRPPRSASTAPEAACAPTGSRASRSCA